MIKLNLGCGWRNFGEDWIHIDGGDYNHLDHSNITKLEFKNNSVDLIYASHVLEYFDRDEVIPILQEWYRVLKPNGILRLAVPNFRAMVELYLSGEYQIENFLGPLYGKMEMGEDMIYHKTTYDWNSLFDLLKKIEFNKIRKYNWKDYQVHIENDDHSQAYIPHMDKENGKLISLNIEAIK